MKIQRLMFSILYMASVIAVIAAPTTPEPLSLIQAAKVAERTFTNQVPWTGIVQSQTAVTLTSPLSGQIEHIGAQDDAEVNKGAILLQLGGTLIEADRSRMTNEVDSLRAQLQLANQTVERIQQDLNDQLATKDQLAAAQQAVINLQSQLQTARVALDGFEQQTRIVAPFDGVFTRRCVTTGQQVKAGDPVAELIDLHHLRIVASLFPPENVDLLNQPATMHSVDGDHVVGKVLHVLPQRSQAGATMVWIEGPEIDQNLRPGQIASGSVTMDVESEIPAIPASAVVYDEQEQAFVLVPDGDGYESRKVRIGRTVDGWVEIISGLKPNEEVVVKGAYELFYRQFSRQYKVRD